MRPTGRCIVGGESGKDARPFDLHWARKVRNAIIRLRLEGRFIPFFFKQVGGRYHDSGGRDLDGRTWDEMPPEVPIIATCERCGNHFFPHMGYYEPEEPGNELVGYSYCMKCDTM